MNTTEIINNAYDVPFFKISILLVELSKLLGSVKLHYVKETHMMLVVLVKIVVHVASQHKRQRKNYFSRFVEK